MIDNEDPIEFNKKLNESIVEDGILDKELFARLREAISFRASLWTSKIFRVWKGIAFGQLCFGLPL